MRCPLRTLSAIAFTIACRDGVPPAGTKTRRREDTKTRWTPLAPSRLRTFVWATASVSLGSAGIEGWRAGGIHDSVPLGQFEVAPHAGLLPLAERVVDILPQVRPPERGPVGA